MANSWFRMYAEFAHDPKVQMLSEVDQRRFVMLLCLRCSNTHVTLHETLQKQDEMLHVTDEMLHVTNDETIAFELRINMEDWLRTKEVLMQKNLIDNNNLPTHWDKRQFISDSSTTRVAEHRKKRKQDAEIQKHDVTKCNVTVTPPDTDTNTELKDSVCVTRAENDFAENEKAVDELTPGFVCRRLTEMGIPKTNPSNPKLLAVLTQGATLADFEYAGGESLDKKSPFAYVLGTVEGILLEKQTKKSRNPPGKVNGYDPLSNNGENYGTKRQNYEANTYAGRKPTAQETQQAARRAWEAKQQRERGDNATPIN